MNADEMIKSGYFVYVSLSEEAKNIVEGWFDNSGFSESIRDEIFKKTEYGWDVIFGQITKQLIEEQIESNESFSDALIRLDKEGLMQTFH
jgi:hypothetical protein